MGSQGVGWKGDGGSVSVKRTGRKPDVEKVLGSQEVWSENTNRMCHNMYHSFSVDQETDGSRSQSTGLLPRSEEGSLMKEGEDSKLK